MFLNGSLEGGVVHVYVEKKEVRLKIVLILTALVACVILLFFQAKGTEQVIESEAGSDDTSRLAGVLESIQGVGRVKIYVHYNESSNESKNQLFSQYFRQQQNTFQSVSGLLIVAEGADNIFVRENLITTISQITQLPRHRIVIVPMKDEEDIKS